jgi:hypothetical protein
MANNQTPLTRNITRVFRKATSEQVTTGLDWYAEAHEFALDSAARHGITLAQSAGILAALSPMQSWGANKALAERFMAAGGLDAGYLPDNLAKARRILSGEVESADILTSNKVGAFFHGILTRGQTDVVCIDRHAWDIAVNVRNTDQTRPGLGSKARYGAAVEAYVNAARILTPEVGMPLFPAELQAVVWVTWRHRFWAEGAFDGHATSMGT